MAFEINSPSTVAQVFDKEVQLQYQNWRYLKGTVAERHGFLGSALNIPISARLTMNNAGFAPTDPQVSQDQYTNVVLVPNNYNLKTVVGGAEQTLYNYDAVASQATDHAQALGRGQDDVVLNTLFNYSGFNSLTVIPDTVGPTTGLNQAKIAAGLAALGNQGVDTRGEQVSLWAPFLTQESFATDNNVVSILYNDYRPLAEGEFSKYMGVSLRWLGSAGENIIPIQSSSGGTDTYLVPLVHRKSMMIGYSRDVQTDVTYLPNMDRWELLSLFTAGAVVLQANGIVLLQCQVPSVVNI